MSPHIVEAVKIGSTLAQPHRGAYRAQSPRHSHYLAKREAIRGSGKFPPQMLELAKWMAKGLPNKTCAVKMGLSVESVRVMGTEVYARAGVHTRPEFVAYWRSREFTKWVKKHGRTLSAEAFEELTALFDTGAEPESQRWLD